MSIQEEDGVPQANLKTVRGDTFVRNLTFVDEDGAAIDITGWTIFFTVKDVQSEGDAASEISKTITTHTNAAAGLSQILVSASDMSATTLKGDFFYDIQVKKADGTITTILKGKLIIDEDITLRTS